MDRGIDQNAGQCFEERILARIGTTLDARTAKRLVLYAGKCIGKSHEIL